MSFRMSLIVLASVFIFGCSESPNIAQEREQKIMDYKDSRSIDEVFESLQKTLGEVAPETLVGLRQVQTDGHLKELEEFLGVTLPDELLEIYRKYDGQEFDSTPFFHRGYEFMSTDRVKEAWSMLQKVNEDFNGRDKELVTDSLVVRDIWWSPKWIPFAENIAGDFYCIDLSPGKAGKHGQIIEFIHDDTIRNHLGYSLKDFLGEYEIGLKERKYIYYKEWTAVVPVDELEEAGVSIDQI